ncbi:nucleotidyltransferase domain-containing protein [Nocardioides sp.]|uniref:nucleotidyltransferase domain-containing protein n=1 Tax=Nocardioides sp. TaxID=35761 RepID=UPI0039C8D2D9
MPPDKRDALAAVERLTRSCEAVLDASVVSVIVHGSLTLDDFQPGRSDLDLLLVVDDALSTPETESLVSVVRDADPGPAGGIDLTVVTREAAAAVADRPCLELHVGPLPRTVTGPGDRRTRRPRARPVARAVHGQGGR